MAVWMYRKGEGRLFSSPEEIPQNEGWVDSPALVSETESTTEEHSRESLLERAEELGIKVNKRWGTQRLADEIAKAEDDDSA
ncbi:MAG: hypothetical protein RIC14_00090 [Filomicrobium sp.]